MADDPQKPLGSQRPVGSAKMDPFKPAMPQIPGVPKAPPKAPPKVEDEAEELNAGFPESRASELEAQLETKSRKMPSVWLVASGVGAFIFVASIAWWMLRGPRSAASPVTSPASSASDTGAGSADSAASAIPVPSRPNEVGGVQELAKPWSAKKFIFTKRYSNQAIPAMVIRLPGVGGVQGYWAFSLQPALGRCELEFVADLNRLAREYGYRANHPMVVNPCTNSVYDPLHMGEIQAGTWARGEVVQGSDIRPPLGIELRVQGNRIVAESIE